MTSEPGETSSRLTFTDALWRATVAVPAVEKPALPHALSAYPSTDSPWRPTPWSDTPRDAEPGAGPDANDARRLGASAEAGDGVRPGRVDLERLELVRRPQDRARVARVVVGAVLHGAGCRCGRLGPHEAPDRQPDGPRRGRSEDRPARADGLAVLGLPAHRSLRADVATNRFEPGRRRVEAHLSDGVLTNRPT